MSPSAFVQAMRAKLAAKEFEDYVVIDLNGSSLAVELRWMGTSRFEFQVAERGDGFRADFVRQRIAPLHGAFTDRFEHYFEDALAKVGAKAV
jgi:hypothetical protein